MGTSKLSTVRDTITFPSAVQEDLRDLTAYAQHNGHPRATKGQVIGWALDLLAQRWASEDNLDGIPPRGDYDLRYGDRIGTDDATV